MIAVATTGLAVLVVAGIYRLSTGELGPNDDLVPRWSHRRAARFPSRTVSLAVAALEAVLLGVAALLTALVVTRSTVGAPTRAVVVVALVVGATLVAPAVAGRLGRPDGAKFASGADSSSRGRTDH